MLRPRLPPTARRGARGPGPDRVRTVVDVQHAPAPPPRPRAPHVRAFERAPAGVAGGVGGEFGLEAAGVAFGVGEDGPPARAGGVAGPVPSSQPEAAAFAEDRSPARETVGDLAVVVVAPAVEAVVAHVEAPGGERRVRLRIRLPAGSHGDPCCGPVGARDPLLRRRDVVDFAHVVTLCSEFQLEEVVWILAVGGRGIVEVLCLQHDRVERMQDSLSLTS